MVSADVADRLRGHLAVLYGAERAEALTGRFAGLLDAHARNHPERPSPRAPYDETDVVLIAYGDHVHAPGEAGLVTLRRFLDRHVGDAVTGVHVLPPYASTSDDGFAVSDYDTLAPGLGTWEDVAALAADRRLMLDAVFNHTSASHPWFTGWLRDDPRFADFYHAVGDAVDLSSVTRPRTTPLLTPFDSASGPRRVWTTFGPDQVDLNYANPEVLLATTAQLLDLLARGAGMVRLDAVAFLWKEPGTSCIHLPQTHEIIRLWRTVVDAVAPGALVVTETNVPHRENTSYFGHGDDEAHLVYQFALPPLTLAAFRSGDARRLSAWLRTVAAPTPTTSFLTFLASHDGIGLRPVEGILADDEIAALCDAAVEAGGRVSYRERPGAGAAPYELNTALLDALTAPGEDAGRSVDRFVAAHALLLSLAGVPAIYAHSLLGSRGWSEGVAETGQPRTINRQRLPLPVLEAELADPSSRRSQVLGRLLHLVRVRASQPAFHPAAEQRVVDAGPAAVSVQRTPPAGGGTVVCVHDVSGRPGRVRFRPAEPVAWGGRFRDLLDGTTHVAEADGTLDVDLPAYGVRWLSVGREPTYSTDPTF